MSGRVFIHATNVHQGGGRALLGALLNVLDSKTEYVLCLDERMPVPNEMPDNVYIKQVRPSIVQRLNAEKWLARNVIPGDIVLCFGNLPPLFKLRGHTIVFVQNRYLIEDVKLNQFPLSVRLRLAVERLWLSEKMANVSEFIVQTPTMKRLLDLKTQGLLPVRVLPFVAEPKGYVRSRLPSAGQQNGHGDFLYVASGEPHKNHRRLIEAWRLLAEEEIFPSLCLTLDETRFAGLCAEIGMLCQRYGLKIKNLGGVSHQDVLTLYTKADAIIYPSTFESFGLPLIEARQAGLPVLAPELDYVRDVLDPEQTFDPDSAISIARAVKQFMGIAQPPLRLFDASSFMASVLEKAA